MLRPQAARAAVNAARPLCRVNSCSARLRAPWNTQPELAIAAQQAPAARCRLFSSASRLAASERKEPDLHNYFQDPANSPKLPDIAASLSNNGSPDQGYLQNLESLQPRPPPPQAPLWRRLLRPALLLYTALGYVAYAYTSDKLAEILPLDPPDEVTYAEEAIIRAALALEASELDAVCTLNDDEEWNTYHASVEFNLHSKQHHDAFFTRNQALTENPEQGLYIYPHMFYHEGSQQLVMVARFGQGTTGWPGIVHGGLISAVLQDACERLTGLLWGLERPASVYNDDVDTNKKKMDDDKDHDELGQAWTIQFGAAWGNEVAWTPKIHIEYVKPVRPRQWYLIVANLAPDEAAPRVDPWNVKHVHAGLADPSTGENWVNCLGVVTRKKPEDPKIPLEEVVEAGYDVKKVPGFRS